MGEFHGVKKPSSKVWALEIKVWPVSVRVWGGDRVEGEVKEEREVRMKKRRSGRSMMVDALMVKLQSILFVLFE